VSIVTSSTPMPMPVIARPEQHPRGGGLHRHDARGGRVPEQRPGKHRATPEPVGGDAEEQCAGEQPREGRRDERGQSAEAEEGRRSGGEQSGSHKARTHVPHEKQVVVLECAAKREHQQQRPDVSRGRQPIEPGMNLRGELRDVSVGGTRARLDTLRDFNGASGFASSS
jgi:hypothetical protein